MRGKEFMLDVSYIDNFISRLPIDDMDFGDNVISDGDVVECYAPDYDFSIINNAVRGYRPYSSKLLIMVLHMLKLRILFMLMG